jgi:hypothetical protein
LFLKIYSSIWLSQNFLGYNSILYEIISCRARVNKFTLDLLYLSHSDCFEQPHRVEVKFDMLLMLISLRIRNKSVFVLIVLTYTQRLTFLFLYRNFVFHHKQCVPFLNTSSVISMFRGKLSSAYEL